MGAPNPANVITDRTELQALFGSTPNLIGELPIDVLVSETPRYESEVTERPLEAGFDATDARILRPTSVSLECILTNAPTNVEDIAANVISGKWNFATWREKFAELKELNRTSAALVVTTPLGIYIDFMITSIIIDRRASTGGALFFSCELKQARFVSTEISEVDESAIPQEKKAEQKSNNDKTKKQKNKGKEQTSEAPAKSESVLSKLGKSFGI